MKGAVGRHDYAPLACKNDADPHPERGKEGEMGREMGKATKVKV